MNVNFPVQRSSPTNLIFAPQTGATGPGRRRVVAALLAAGIVRANSASTAAAVIAPSIVTAPAIIGTPQVGVPVYFSVGTYSGSTPTSYSIAWSINGAIVVGEAGITYTPITQDEADALRVIETVGNSAGSVVNTSDPKTVTAAGTYNRPTSEMPSDWRPFKRLATGGNTLATFRALDDALYGAVSPLEIEVDPTYILTPAEEVGPGGAGEGPIGSLYVRDFGIQLATFTLRSSVPGTPAIFNLAPRSQANVLAGGALTAINLGAGTRNSLIQDIHAPGYRPSGQGSNAFCTANSGYGQGDPEATVTFRRCRMQDWTNGVITTHNANLHLVYEDSLTQDCTGSGLSHGLYASVIGSVTAKGSAWIHTPALNAPGSGHLFKARPRTVTIDGCYFFSGYGGARVFDISNGGDFTLRGSVVCKAAADSFGNENMILGFGAEQTPFFNILSPNRNPAGDPADASYWTYVNDGRTHSVTIEQCTFWHDQVAASLTVEDIKIWPNITNADDSPATVAVTIRNNIVASKGAADFVAAYPNNTGTTTLADVDPTTGIYSGSPIPCDPDVNDAPWAFQGYFLPALARTDKFRGGRRVSAVPNPAWRTAQTTANHWYDIPGSSFTATFKDDGTGVDGTGRTVPAATPRVYGSGGYAAIPANGGWCWSIKNKEGWIIGGGHAATDLNVTAKFRAGQESPDFCIASAMTPYTTRLADFQASDTLTKLSHSAGSGFSVKPFAFHPYRQITYSDVLDEFIVMSQPNIDPGPSHTEVGVWSSVQQMSMPRTADESLGGNGNWRALNYWPNSPYADSTNRPTSQSGTGENLAVYSRDGRYAYRIFGSNSPLWEEDLVAHTRRQVTASVVDWASYAHGDINPALGTAGALIWISDHSPDQTQWYLQKIDLATGVQTAITISGVARNDASVAGSAWGLNWVDHLGVYTVLQVNGAGHRLVKMTPTNGGHTAMTASAVAMTGTAPIDTDFRRYMAYDPDWQDLIVTDGPTRPWKRIHLA